MKSYKHLSEEEREKIAALLQDGKKGNEIALELERDESTISREIKRNKTMIDTKNNNNPKAKKDKKNSYYFPYKAQKKYENRRKESKQRLGLKSLELREFVLNKLKEGLSPILISGRAKLLEIGSISHETIYQFIYRKENKYLKLWECLIRSHKRRKPKRSRKSKRYLIPDRIGIENRLEKINSREEFGHWEADSIFGLRGTFAALHTEVERKTRLIRIRKIGRKTAKITSKTMKEIFEAFPIYARKSTTADNGSEFCDWKYLQKTLGMMVFFANPYHSWERGTNERANGLVRRIFPKRTDFTNISEEDIQKVEDWINNRPMKCLNFLTPNEAFNLHIATLSKNCT